MKAARVKFSNSTLYKQEIDIFLIKDILMALPSDSKVVGMDYDINSHNNYLTVLSSSFVNTPFGQYFPEILVHLVQNPSKTGWLLDSLDMSVALQVYQTQQVYNPVCLGGPLGCGICSNCVQLISPPIVPPTFTRTMSPNFTIPSEYSLAGTNTGGFTGGCNHSWKNYQGLNESFEYCVTCNEKKK